MPKSGSTFRMTSSAHKESTTALSAAPSLNPTYYPAYTHSSHPLTNTWIKVTAAFLQRLRVPPGFDASITSTAGPALPLYHHLNHPIPFVDICGIVVDSGLVEKLGAWSVLIDDGSGVLAEALCRKVKEEENGGGNFGGQGRGEANGKGRTRLAGPGELIVPPVPEWKGRGWMGGEELDMRVVRMGKVLRIKGRVKDYKGQIQVLAERMFPIRTTAEEVQFWQSMCDTFQSVLARPWMLSDKQLRNLRKKFDASRRERKEGKPRKKRRKEEEIKHEDKALPERAKIDTKADEISREYATDERKDPEKGRNGPTHVGPPQNEIEGDPQPQASPYPPRTSKAASGDLKDLTPQVIKTVPPNAMPNLEAKSQKPKERQDKPPHPPQAADITSSSAIPTSGTEGDATAREQLQDETQGPIIINRGSPSKRPNLEIDLESSNEPPPGNQQAMQGSAAPSSSAGKISKGTERTEDASSYSGIAVIDRGLPSGWAGLDVAADMDSERNSKVLLGNDWLEVFAGDHSGSKTTTPEGKVSSNAAEKGEDSKLEVAASSPMAAQSKSGISAFDWEDEWERVAL